MAEGHPFSLSALKVLFQSCQTATKSFLLQNSLMGVVEGVGPYGDMGEDIFPFPRAYRDKIGAGTGIIISRETHPLSFRLVHFRLYPLSDAVIAPASVGRRAS